MKNDRLVHIAYKYIQNKLNDIADKRRAEGEKKYLKSPWKFYGVSTPDRRRIVTELINKFPDLSKDDLLSLVQKLWNGNWHEEKSIAIILLTINVEVLNRDDLMLIEQMVDSVTGWDHLDEISLRIVAPLVSSDKYVWDKVRSWIKEKNYWKRRVVILCQIPQFRQGKGDFNTFADSAVLQFDEKEDWSKEERFFIRKAIGWALRELSKTKPDWVVNFVNDNKNDMPGLTYREATRKLPDDYKAQLN